MTFEAYWSCVFGARSVQDLVSEFELKPGRQSLDEWLGESEQIAMDQGAELDGAWHGRALDQLVAAVADELDELDELDAQDAADELDAKTPKAPDRSQGEVNLHLPNVHRTAAEARRVGEALGLEGPALDLWVKAGAAGRQRIRIEEARIAAEAWAADWCTPGGAVVAALLDANGVGGHFGTGESGGTARHPAFASCGHGRKFAQDGACWTAAIATIAAGRSLRLGLVPERAAGWGPAAAAIHESTQEVIAVGDDLHTPARAWVVALARAIVVGLARGEGPWSHQELELANEVIARDVDLEPLPEQGVAVES